METFLNVGLANAALATTLAVLVMLATRVWRNPFAAHVLWMLVLVKFVTPPMVEMPFSIPPISLQTDRQHPQTPTDADSLLAADPPLAEPLAEQVYVASPVDANSASELMDSESESQQASQVLARVGVVIAVLWLGGCILKLLVVALRLWRFDALVRGSPQAPAEIAARVAKVCREVGIKRLPDVRTTDATIAPLVWSFLRRPVLVLPGNLLRELGEAEQATIFAHELSHMSRRDYWVRWLESIVSILYWWNPVVGFAMKSLHQAEEECCDAAVLQLFPGQSHLYGEVLLRTAEFVTGQRATPSLASPLGTVHQLKRRVQMITHDGSVRRLTLATRCLLLLVALAIVPLSAAGQVASEREGDQQKAAEATSIPASPAEDGTEAKPKNKAAQDAEWQIRFNKDSIIVSASRDVPTGLIQGTIKACQNAGYKKFKLAVGVKTVSSDPTIRIRLKDGQAVIAASSDVEFKAVVALLDQLRASKIKSITLESIDAKKSAKKKTKVPVAKQVDPFELVVFKHSLSERQLKELQRMLPSDVKAVPDGKDKLIVRAPTKRMRQVREMIQRVQRAKAKQNPNPPKAAKLNGVILAVDNNLLASISVGADDGLQPGTRLTVYRGQQYVGQIVVAKLEPNRALATVVTNSTKSKIQKGDRITTVLAARNVNSGQSPLGISGRSALQAVKSVTAAETKAKALPIAKVADRAKGKATTQLFLAGPQGMNVQWETSKRGVFDSPAVVCPARVSFERGNLYRLKLTKIPEFAGAELYPSLQVAAATVRTTATLEHSAVPLQFTKEDIDQAMAGNFVTKVVYQPDPKFQEQAIAGIETLVTQRLDAGVDPIAEADRRGTILAVMRLGNRQANVKQVRPIRGR